MVEVDVYVVQELVTVVTIVIEVGVTLLVAGYGATTTTGSVKVIAPLPELPDGGVRMETMVDVTVTMFSPTTEVGLGDGVGVDAFQRFDSGFTVVVVV